MALVNIAESMAEKISLIAGTFWGDLNQSYQYYVARFALRAVS